MRWTLGVAVVVALVGCASEEKPVEKKQQVIKTESPPEKETRPPNPSEYYTLQLKGWSDTEADTIQSTLAKQPGFSRWKEKGVQGDIHVFNFAFQGELVLSKIRQALEAEGIKVRTEKSGNTITVFKG